MAKNQYSNSFHNLESIEISSIILDYEIQPRCQIYDDVVAKYAEAMRQGTEFPPVLVFFNGSNRWLVDGFHRIQAMKAIGEREILTAISQGNRQDAILHATGANIESELRLTEADLQRNVYKLIGHPEWKLLTDKQIADQCGTDDKYVYGLREERITNLYRMVVELNKIGKDRPSEPPLKAKYFNFEAAMNMDATTFGPLISDLFLDVWVDMVIDKIIKKQRENKSTS